MATGKIIISKDPNLFWKIKYKKQATITTKITLIISPIPFKVTPLVVICIAPEPNIAEVPISVAPAPLNLNWCAAKTPIINAINDCITVTNWKIIPKNW